MNYALPLKPPLGLRASKRRRALGAVRIRYAAPACGVAVSGRRYYTPAQGRFLGRDPIEEEGGLHLYGFCRNNPTNLRDALGMVPSKNPDSREDRQEEDIFTYEDGSVHVAVWIADSTMTGWIQADSFVRLSTMTVSAKPIDAWWLDEAPDSAPGYWSQVGSYFGNYLIGVAESPLTLLKGVGQGYAAIGGLAADATTGQFWKDVGTMATNPGATAASIASVGAGVVTGTVASFSDGRNLGNFVGGAAIGSIALPGALSTLSNASKGAIGEATSLVTNLASGNIPIGSQVPISVAGRTPVIDWQFQNVFTGSVTLVESKFGTAGLTSAQRASAPLLTVEKWTYPFWSNVGAGGGAAGGAAGSGKGP